MKRTKINVGLLNLVVNNRFIIYSLSKNILVQVTSETVLKNRAIEEFITVMDMISADLDFALNKEILRNLGEISMNEFWKLFLISVVISDSLVSNVGKSNYRGSVNMNTKSENILLVTLNDVPDNKYWPVPENYFSTGIDKDFIQRFHQEHLLYA